MVKKNKQQQSELNSITHEPSYNERQMITMVDYISLSDLSEIPKGSVHCYWDKHAIHTIPLGIPVIYFPAQIEHSYHSYHVDKLYSLHKMISDNDVPLYTDVDEKSDILQSQLSKYMKQHSTFYLTDGFVCSFNCMYSYIDDNIHNPLYEYSKEYMYDIYTLMNKNNKVPIVKAPSWRLLDIFGGSSTIHKFRKEFNSIEYHFVNEYKINLPICKTIGMIYNEQFLL